MSERIERADPVVAAIRKLQPVTLKVRLLDGSERTVAMPKAGNRWARIAETLDALQWETLECVDKDGKLLGAPIERDIEPEEDFDDEDGDLTASTLRAILRDAMRVNLEIMRTTMKETRQIFDSQTKSQSELVGVMVEGLRAVQESYSLAMRVQTAQLVSGPEGGNSEVMDMMKMALMMNMKGAAPPPPPKPAAPPRQAIPPKQEVKP